MTWFKNEADSCTNGKLAEAGPDGCLAYWSLLCLHTKKGSNGVVPASCCRPARLRAEAVAFLGTFDLERIEAAIDACIRADLIEFVGADGAQVGVRGAQVRAECAIRLRGWSDAHAVACSHCRKPNPEPSHKTCPTCREARSVDRQPRKQAGARRSRAHGASGAQNGVRGAHLAALDSDSDSDSDKSPLPPKSGERAVARGADPLPNPEPNAEPETRPVSKRRDDGASPIADLTAALIATRYRAGIGNAIVRRAEIRMQVESTLLQTGLTPAHVRELGELAVAKSSGDPGALLATWLDGGAWREVLDEQRSKRRQVDALAKGAAAATADVLDGIYGGSQPKPAASVVDDVLRAAAGGVA